MKLDDAQTARVRQWIEQGLKVSEIQTRLAAELGIHLTYMEARLLLDDLQLRPKDPPPAPKMTGPLAASPAPAPAPAGKPPGLKATPIGGETPAGGRVSVSVDNLARPGALVSGKVTFSDGQKADWQMDQYGRLAVAPTQIGYKPSQADMMDFQAELESALARLGY